MKYFSLTSNDAFRELHEAITCEEPVTAVFMRTTMHATVIQFSVDGVPNEVHITLRRDGSWDATYFKEPLK
jgi:hypothetical protein